MNSTWSLTLRLLHGIQPSVSTLCRVINVRFILTPPQVSLQHKRSLLLRQTEDARELKENLERRQCVVHAILSGYLTEPQLQDYGHFVSAKPSLLIRQRHLDDLTRQGEEQLKRLEESLPAELTEASGCSTASRLSSPVLLPPLLPPSVLPGPTPPVRSTTVTSL